MTIHSWAVIAGLTAVVAGCPQATREPAPPNVSSAGTRSYRMGFSVVPPKPDIKVAVQSMEIWTKHADAAIMHMDVPWALLLGGASPEDALRKDGVDLERYYRAKHLQLIVTIDVTNGRAARPNPQRWWPRTGASPSRRCSSYIAIMSARS